MANEQIAMLLGSGWTAPIVDSVNPDLNAFKVLGVADVPIKAGAAPEFRTTAWLSAWAINPNTEHPEEAWELVKFIIAKSQEQKWLRVARGKAPPDCGGYPLEEVGQTRRSGRGGGVSRLGRCRLHHGADPRRQRWLPDGLTRGQVA